MPRVRALPILLTALLTVLFGAGCGGATVPVTDWARDVCGALGPWREGISELTVKAQQQMSTTTTPEQTKANIVGLLAGAERASETARRGVEDAGAPDIDNGEEIADRFIESLRKARDAYGNARKTVADLPITDASTFYQAVTAAFMKLGEDYAASEIDPSQLGSAQLQAAFDEVPQCQ